LRYRPSAYLSANFALPRFMRGERRASRALIEIPLFHDRWFVQNRRGLIPVAVFCVQASRMKRSAGILMFRGRGRGIRLLLVHPGGPFWAKKDDGAWSIPKGEYDEGEDPLAVARREFEEELGSPAPAGGVIELGELVQPSRKQIIAYAIEGDFDPSSLKSNLFEMEWPPKSGTMQSFPEVDRAEWFTVEEAREKILSGQRAFIERLLERLEIPAR
jgi:predicted NUDIX family NTP pyrophosphohydrolase